MKKRLLKTVLISSLLTLVGCDSSTDNTNVASNDLGQNIRMEKNKPYTVEQGDKIEKLSAEPSLKIESDLNSGKTTVTLLSGDATIIKK